jgi:hypothetical protein
LFGEYGEDSPKLEFIEALFLRFARRQFKSLMESMVRKGRLGGTGGKGVLPSSAQKSGMRVWLLSGNSMT